DRERRSTPSRLRSRLSLMFALYMLAQNQFITPLGKIQLLQGAHAQQHLIAENAGHYAGTDPVQTDVAQLQGVDTGAPALGQAIGSVDHDRPAPLQLQAFGQIS